MEASILQGMFFPSLNKSRSVWRQIALQHKSGNEGLKMLRTVLLVLALLGVTNHATAGLMSYAGSGTFDDGGTFEFTFDWNDTSLGFTFPDNITMKTTGGSLLPSFDYSGAASGSLAGGDPPVVEQIFMGIDVEGDFREFEINFNPGLNPTSGIVTLSGFEKVTDSAGAEVQRNISSGTGSVQEATVPAPATLALFGLGLAGLGWSRRKKA